MHQRRDSKRKVLLSTVLSETNERMTNQFDLGNCLALAYLSEYASSDDRIKDSYDIYALPPIKAYTEHDENVFIKRISHIKPYLLKLSGF